jgi:TetR/AcrR family transcriptional regulator of autoinduction and epiphytic fitness
MEAPARERQGGVETLDGRSARAERTRSALVDAHLNLLEEGHLRPTAEQIAERAGCSPRSVFKHFPDRESFLAAVSEAQRDRVESLLEPIPGNGPLDVRLEAFVAQRVRIFEHVTPVRRAALLMEPFSETVASWLDYARTRAREEVARVFAPELQSRAAGERADLQAALAAAAAWPSWESLRRHQGLSVERARAALRRTLEALLES